MKREYERGVILYAQPPGWGFIFLLIGVAIAVLWASSFFDRVERTLTQNTETPEMMEPPTKGVPNAPVSILEFAEFYCPFCDRHFRQTLPQLEAEYIRHGLVKYSFYNFVVHGPPAQLAAQAGECAHFQGKFWEYHDRLFVAAFQEKKSYLSVQELTDLARELRLNEQEFSTCLQSERAASAVAQDQAKLQELMAQLPESERKAQLGTPTFFINGRLLIGAQPFEKFQAILFEELSKQKK